VSARIVHLASGREWRGGQRQVWLLARELGRLGVDQVVVTGHGSALAARLASDGVPRRLVSWHAGLDPRVLVPLLREVRRATTILHAHDAHALTLGGMVATLAGRPLVVTRRVDFHLRRRGFWMRADRVIAISHAVARVLAADGIRPERIAVVHSGLDLDAVRRTPGLGIRTRLGLDQDVVVAANVAALVGHKDHATLLRAAARLMPQFPRLHWVVAGEGPERADLERLRDELGLTDRLHLVGHLDDPAQLIADANLFVMSSREEGLGTSVLEAMALGVPVASTSAGGLPEMLGDGAGVLTPPSDPAALADAVARLLSEPDLARSVVRRARAVAERFSAARMAEAVLSVYRSCDPFH
jgi:glycosyltransferase involved in cell wall biosynthesis